MRFRDTALWLLVLLPVACDNNEFHQCDGGTSDVVCSLSAVPTVQGSDAGGVTYVVAITATVPNLIGGAQVLVSTSDGTVAGAAPGTEASVFLPAEPGAPRGSGLLAGKAIWRVPLMVTAELTVRMEEATTTVEVTPP